MRNPPPKLVGARWGDKEWENRSLGPLVRVQERWGDRLVEREVRAPFDARFAIRGGSLWPLYHATTRVREIVAGGFRLDKKGGLGGMSTGKSVSFTQSLPFACMIARSLVDVIRLAAGFMGPRDVIERATRESGDGTALLDKMIEWYEINRRSRGGIPEPAVIGTLTGDQREVAWWLYRSYLRARSELKLDWDPGFFSVHWTAFENLDESNVGVLECEVQRAVWVRDEPTGPFPGAVTYHGWGRPKFAPDQDEYRAYDMDSIRVIDVVEKERCS